MLSQISPSRLAVTCNNSRYKRPETLITQDTQRWPWLVHSRLQVTDAGDHGLSAHAACQTTWAVSSALCHFLNWRDQILNLNASLENLSNSDEFHGSWVEGSWFIFELRGTHSQTWKTEFSSPHSRKKKSYHVNIHTSSHTLSTAIFQLWGKYLCCGFRSYKLSSRPEAENGFR